MPAPPAEVVAEFTIHPVDEDGSAPHVEAGLKEARDSGLAVEAGPHGTGLAGPRDEVLDALRRVVEAAIDAGAESFEIKLEMPSQAR